jgi:hypothetical protein
MTPWRFKGAKLNARRTEPFLKKECGYLAAGCGDADGWGAGGGAVAADPEVVGWGAGGVAAVAVCGCAAGLIQQPWT